MTMIPLPWFPVSQILLPGWERKAVSAPARSVPQLKLLGTIIMRNTALSRNDKIDLTLNPSPLRLSPGQCTHGSPEKAGLPGTYNRPWSRVIGRQGSWIFLGICPIAVLNT